MKSLKLAIVGIALFAVSSLFITNCKSPDVLLREGRYDLAIDKCVKKLKKKPTKEKYTLVLEKAFKKVNQRDNERTQYLKKEGAPETKAEIADIYQRMKNRQSKIRPLVPLHIASEGRDARFDFVNVDDQLIAAKKDAAEYLYANAMKLMEKNDRMSARKAYNDMQKIKRDYFSNYKDIDQQIPKAEFLGTNKVIFKMKNTTGVPLPPRFERDLTKISLGELDRKWLRYYTSEDKSVFYDYSIIVAMRVIDVSPERINKEIKIVKKEVQDGWEYFYDAKGNVMKDTAGNDIKKMKYKTVQCEVKETIQSKVARIEATVDYYDNRSKQMIRSFPAIIQDVIFEHHYATARGEDSILDAKTKAMLKKEMVPFPPDFDLLLQAGERLKPVIKTIIHNNKNLVKY